MNDFCLLMCNPFRPVSFLEQLCMGDNNPTAGHVLFHSIDHIRYENGRNVSGHNFGCQRVIKIEKNIEGNEGYTVTVFNLDGNHPFWGNQIQMAPKQMKVITYSETKVELQGYGYDMVGESFADYGLTIYLDQKQIYRCILHLYDRQVDIEYMC